MSEYSTKSLYITEYLLNIIKIREARINESRKLTSDMYMHSYGIYNTTLISDAIYLKCLLEFDGVFKALQSDDDNAHLNYLIVRNKVIVWMLKSVYTRNIESEITILIDIIYKTYNRIELEKTKKLESEFLDNASDSQEFNLELLFDYCIPNLSFQLTEWAINRNQDILIDNFTNFVRDKVLSNELVTFDTLLRYSEFLTIIIKCFEMHSINKQLLVDLLIVCTFAINTKFLDSGSYI